MLPPLPRCSRWAYSSLKLTHPCQPSPIPLSGRPAHRPFRGLLGVHSRWGLHTRAVTKFVTAIRGLQHFVTSMPAPVASGWSDRRVGLAPTGKAPPCHGARGERTFGSRCCGPDTGDTGRLSASPPLALPRYVSATPQTCPGAERAAVDQPSRTGQDLAAGTLSWECDAPASHP